MCRDVTAGLKLLWTPQALKQRIAIRSFIAQHDPIAAVRMERRLNEAAARLLHFPELGTASRCTGAREYVAHEHYRLIYEFNEGVIWIIGIAHTSRRSL
ncbi:type II toxin-antitoxin system RelE/ParE family toxin [Cupriavidus taiwanensis]|uniref:Putative toxin of a toxin/antitoxin system, parE-like n=1 Tax=Cupriavidus taiwanensis TaxID=164546 RepID=A0A7Z7J4W7_9BURK|nr:putative toxin of a toxin/antitoxin system, parE-like [Cupriavidus taiwanensis]SOY90090.1 putative toxin of a toxin/antitoxin system, parE-like [Cupriavidus taiwanensis]SOZ00532.1 putative toxin of a toxin/antitoxin system, parE-like [Cupriavidus taiwanensis]SOZ03634.1 putative toxin of a toxin/antitoxin system, parE-like [Cupriavidus taiwanensis]SPC07873.1 putative toxin of a toxin/antitoxin system, parE-like [Cupriavidus taiwanensis]